MFVAPGLYRSEKKAFLPFLIATTPILFVMGAALAYYFVFPVAWRFFLSFETPDGAGGLPIELQAKVGEYLDLVMKLIFAFGIAFQLPVLLTLAGQGRHRLVPKRLKQDAPLRLRRYVRRRRRPHPAGRHHPMRPRDPPHHPVRDFDRRRPHGREPSRWTPSPAGGS